MNAPPEDHDTNAPPAAQKKGNAMYTSTLRYTVEKAELQPGAVCTLLVSLAPQGKGPRLQVEVYGQRHLQRRWDAVAADLDPAVVKASSHPPTLLRRLVGRPVDVVLELPGDRIVDLLRVEGDGSGAAA